MDTEDKSQKVYDDPNNKDFCKRVSKSNNECQAELVRRRCEINKLRTELDQAKATIEGLREALTEISELDGHRSLCCPANKPKQIAKKALNSSGGSNG